MAATILLADGDPISRTDWEVLLRDQGYTVIPVQSEESLLDLCPIVRPDVVLINSTSAELRGPEICRLLKADPRNKLTPVLLITAPSDSAGAPSGEEICADDLWGGAPSRWEALNRLQTLLHMKSYIDEQAAMVITSLARSIESRDPYMKGHCDRLAVLASQFGRSLDMGASDLEALVVAASIHDIGKVMLPDAILLKPGWLTVEEIKLMEQHPIEGERICSPLKSLRDVLPIIRHHHERMDGSGYPDGLRRSRIPYGARVFQILDIYDALTTDRAYRKAISAPAALATLAKEAESDLLDQELVNQFLSLVAARPIPYIVASSARNEWLSLGG